MEQKKRVLIVEDEKNIVDIIRFNLGREGFDVLDRLAALPTTGSDTWNKPLQMPLMARVRVTSDAPLPPVRRLP